MHSWKIRIGFSLLACLAAMGANAQIGAVYGDHPGDVLTKYDVFVAPGAGKLASRLANKLADRSLEVGCESLAPIESELILGSTPAIGRELALTYNFLNAGDFKNSTVRWSATGGARLSRAGATDSGTAEKGRAYTFNNGLVIPGDGTYKVSATATIAQGTSSYAQTKSIWFVVSGGDIQVLDKDPAVLPTGAIGTVPKPNTGLEIVQPEPTAGLRPIPADEIEVPGDTLFGTVTTTVTGSLVVRGPLNNFVGAYGGAVDIVRSSDNAVLATFIIDINGNYSGDVTTAGATTCKLRLRARNSRTACKTDALADYQSGYFSSFVINGGTVDSGGWNYDDNNYNRAFYVNRELSRGWAESNYTLGHDAVYCEAKWQNGTTGGAFYDLTRIQLRQDHFFSPDVILHEYGHHHQNSSNSMTDWPPNTGGAHGFLDHINVNLAWTEGYASYFMIQVQNELTYNNNNPTNTWSFDLEENWDGDSTPNGNNNGTSNALGYDTESAVCAYMADLFDSFSDTYDYSTFGGGPGQDVLQNYNPAGHNVYEIQEWIDGFSVRNQPYLPKVYGQAMTHGMKQVASRPVLGLSAGMDKYAGTWYWAGYGRGSYTARNYGSQNVAYNSLWVWLRGPGNNDHDGGSQIGFEGAGSLASGDTNALYETTTQVFPNEDLIGAFTLTAGQYDSSAVFRNLLPAEPGTNTVENVTVVRDPDGPDFCNVDDGVCGNSLTSLPFTATTTESESSIRGFYYRIGTAVGTGNIRDWTWVATGDISTWNYTATGLSLALNVKYYVTVAAYNMDYNNTIGYGDGVLAKDGTAPTSVTCTDDGATTNSLTQLHWVSTAVESNGCIDSWWYWIEDDTTGAVVRGWTEVLTGNVTNWDYTATGLSLVNGRTYIIHVAAENASNLFGYGDSNGIRVAIPYQLTGKVVMPGLPAGLYNGRNVWVGVGSQAPTSKWDQIYQWRLVPMNASGVFTVTDNTWFEGKRIAVLPGDVVRWMTRTKNATLPTGANYNAGTFTLLNGDCNGDNSCDFFDYLVLSGTYEKSLGDAGYNTNADLNLDNTVDLFDYFLLSDNYEKDGDW